MLFLPPPALFQLPGSPFSLPKSRISPLFLSATPHGMLPASGPGGKIPSRQFRFRQIHGPLHPFSRSSGCSVRLYSLYSFFYISIIQAAEAEQPNGCPAKQPGQGGTPLPFRHFPDKQKSDGFPRFFRKRKTPAGRPLYQSIRECIRQSASV